MTSTVLYCRISKDREGRQVGVDRQEADARALAERQGLTVDRVFVDNDISASTLSKKRRPAYEEMMRLAEAGHVDTILAYSNSRLTRRPLELERLIEAHKRTGVRFRTVVSGDDDLSTADGRMVARIKANVDAAESERMGERIRRAKQESRDAGKWHGGQRSFGFGDNGITPDPAEAAIVAEVCQAILDGRSVISRVKDLNERGITTSTGGPWTSRTLLRVLNKPNPGVDEDLAEAVRLLLADPSRRTTPGPTRRWLLSGFTNCGVCGGPVRGSGSSKGVGQGTYPAYRCHTGKHVVISAVSLDEYVTTLVVGRLSKPDAADLFVPADVNVTALRREAKNLRERLDRMADNIDLDERQLARRSKALRQRLDEIQTQLVGAVRTSPLAEFNGADPVGVWLGLDLERRRGVVGALLRITINRTARGLVPAEHRWRRDLPAFDPRRVQLDWTVRA